MGQPKSARKKTTHGRYRPALDATHLPIIRRLARRVKKGQPWGVTAPDVAEQFDISPRVAHKCLERFCRPGWIQKTELQRFRPDMVGMLSKKAIIYIATSKHLEETRWRQLFRTPRPARPQTA